MVIYFYDIKVEADSAIVDNNSQVSLQCIVTSAVTGWPAVTFVAGGE